VEGNWGFFCGEDYNLWSVRKASPSVVHMTPISFVEISEARFPALSMMFENDLKIGEAWTVCVSVLI
jgi:hypothetical protein